MLRHIINTIVAVISLTALINLLCVMPPDPNRDENAKVKKITIESGVDSSTVLIDKEVTIEVSLMLAYRIDSVVIDFDDGNDTVLMPGEWDTTLTFKHIFDSVGKKVVEATVYTATATPKSSVYTVMVVKPVTLLKKEVSVSGNPVLDKKYTFSVSAEGTGTVEYEWYKGNTVLHKSEDSTYTIVSLTEADTGEYFCIVSNLYGSDTSFSYTLTLDETLPPVIENDKKVFVEGEIETDSRCFLYITASGSQELAYQWYKDNKTIKNETSDTLVFSSLSVDDNGVYKCIVTNEHGSDTSLEYTIEVGENIKPLIQNNKEVITTGSLFKDSTVTLSISASGTEPLSYSWYKEGSETVLSTEPKLTLEELSSGTEGEYYCIVSNSFGKDTSVSYEIKIIPESKPLPVILNEKAVQTKGTPVTDSLFKLYIEVYSDGETVNYQWYKDDNSIENETSDTLVFSSLSLDDNGVYKCIVTNEHGSDTSLEYTVEVGENIKPIIQNNKEVIITGSLFKDSTVTLSISASGTEPLSYSWYKEGSETVLSTEPKLTLENLSSEAEGEYYCIVSNSFGKDTSVSYEIKIIPESKPLPVILNEKAVQTKGTPVTDSLFKLYIEVYSDGETVNYQWYKDDNSIENETSDTLVFSSLSLDDNGVYKCIVTNEHGSDTSLEYTIEVGENIKPIIQNNKEVIITGSLFKDSTVTLSISASGTEPLSYSWYKEGSETVLSTEPELTLENLSSEAEGEYYCIVTNELGSDTSKIYELALKSQPIPLAFTDKPVDTTVTAGTYLMFTVEFSGTVVSVQWLKNGEVIEGATEAEYEFQAVTSVDAGEYEVKICNDKDCIVSEPFTLLVLPDSVSGLKAQARSAKSIKVTWNKIAGASGYMVLRSDDDETFDSIANTSDTAILDTPLVEGSRYSYRIIAQNNNGSSDTSDIVSSTTWSGPKITSQPKGLTLIEGDSLELSVVATGNPDVTYQWIKDGDSLPGATEASYILNGVAISDAGAYRVIVSNKVRSVNSDQVTVTVKREYGLDTKVSSSGGGTISRNPDKEKYVAGEDVELTAIPDQCYRFDNWTGDISGENPVITIEMDTAKKVTANFVKQFTLTLESSLTSRGTVSPSGNTTVDKGGEISITAMPNTGFKFIKWTVVSGTASITDETSANTKVKLDSDDATVQAEFKSVSFIKKSISISGYESVLPKYAIQMNDSQYLVVADCQTSSSESYSGSIILNHFGDTVRTNLIQRDITLNSIRPANNGFIADGRESYDEKIIVSFSSNGNYKGIKNYNYLQFSSGNGITIQTNDNGYAMMGTTIPNVFYLVKTGANGDTIWTKTYDKGSFQSFCDGIQTSDGGYLLVGAYTMGQGGWVIKTDQNGAITWDSLYSAYLGTEEQRFGAGFNSVIEVNDGYIVGGNMRNTTGIILKIDFSGDVLWSKTYPNLNGTRAVRQKSNGNFVLAGNTNNIGNGGSDIYLVETNPDGVIIGEERTFGTANDEYCNSMELTKDGEILIVGSNGWIIKTDENGNVDP